MDRSAIGERAEETKLCMFVVDSIILKYNTQNRIAVLSVMYVVIGRVILELPQCYLLSRTMCCAIKRIWLRFFVGLYASITGLNYEATLPDMQCNKDLVDAYLGLLHVHVKLYVREEQADVTTAMELYKQFVHDSGSCNSTTELISIDRKIPIC